MNSKQIAILIVFVVLAWSLLHGNGQASGTPEPYHVVNCGAAPGDANILDRLTWALCESNESVKQDAAAGR